jgi:hypothetical protein
LLLQAASSNENFSPNQLLEFSPNGKDSKEDYDSQVSSNPAAVESSQLEVQAPEESTVSEIAAGKKTTGSIQRRG